MKKYLPLPVIAFLLLAMFIFVGCGAKATAPTPTVAEAPAVQEPEEKDESPLPEAVLKDEPQSPEQETHPETTTEETMPAIEIPSGSVLHLIPEQTLGLIYCPNLQKSSPAFWQIPLGLDLKVSLNWKKLDWI